MYLNKHELKLLKQGLLVNKGKISEYTIINMSKLFGGRNINSNINKSNIKTSLMFVNGELRRIKNNISKYPHLQNHFDNLVVQATKINDGKSFCEVLDFIARLDIAMGLPVSPRISRGIDKLFYELYYQQIIDDNFEDPYKDPYIKEA